MAKILWPLVTLALFFTLLAVMPEPPAHRASTTLQQ